MRTAVRIRPGLGLSSSTISCCNHAASAYSRCNTSRTRHPEGIVDESILRVSPWEVCGHIGIDVHKKESQIDILAGSGEVVEEG
jgi:hypothetical protein